MAQPTENSELERLIRRIGQSRSAVDHHARTLRDKLDVPTRIKSSLNSNPLAWFGGSVGVGLLTSWILRRPKKTQKRRGWSGLLLGTLFTLAKPTVQSVITSELQRRFIGHPRTLPPEE